MLSMLQSKDNKENAVIASASARKNDNDHDVIILMMAMVIVTAVDGGGVVSMT